MQATATLNRRQFLGASSGLTLAFVLPALGHSPRAEATIATRVNTWLTIGSDNSITLTVGASDMGQGSFQGLAQLLAEDLMVDYRRVVLAQGGPTMASSAPVGTAINTVGSGVTRNNYWRLRDAAAIAREMLVTAAMNGLGDTSRSNYTVTDGVIRHESGQTLTYGQVADAAALLPPLPALKAALDQLRRLAASPLLAAAPDLQVEVALDLGDLRGYRYHSGTIFAAYVDGAPNAIGRGGRYDNVGAAFGRARAATGFSLELRELAALLREPAPTPAVRAPWADDRQLADAVRGLRAAGQIVVQALPGHEPEQQEFLCDRELIREGGGWVVRPLRDG